VTEHDETLKYGLERVVEYRLYQPTRGPRRPTPARRRRQSLALHPAIGLLLAIGVSMVFWTLLTWALVRWVW